MSLKQRSQRLTVLNASNKQKDTVLFCLPPMYLALGMFFKSHCKEEEGLASRAPQVEQQANFALHLLRQWQKKKVILKISFSLFYHCNLVKSIQYHSHHRMNIPEHFLPG